MMKQEEGIAWKEKPGEEQMESLGKNAKLLRKSTSASEARSRGLEGHRLPGKVCREHGPRPG